MSLNNKSNIKKAPNTLETEELLDLLDLKDEAGQPSELGFTYKNDIITFISIFNLKPGEDVVKSFTLYSIYKVWSKNPVSKTVFYNELNSFLPNTTQGHFKLNQNAIKLTHEAYSRFKQENRRLKNKKWAAHFEDFLLFYALKNENYWLEDYLLRKVYLKYAEERNILDNIGTFMGELVFSVYADLFLKYKKTKTGKVYSVSENVLNHFKPGQLERLRKAYAKEQQRKEKKSKRSSRKSRSRNKIQPKDES